MSVEFIVVDARSLLGKNALAVGQIQSVKSHNARKEKRSNSVLIAKNFHANFTTEEPRCIKNGWIF